MSDDQNSWNHQVMKANGSPLFTDVSLNGSQSAHLTFECNTCLQRFVWIEHMPYLLTGAKESKGTKAKRDGSGSFPITIYSLTGETHQRNCQVPVDLIKKGESSMDKPSSSVEPSGSPSTPPTPSRPAKNEKPTDNLSVFAQEMYKDMDALRTDIQQIKKVLERIAEKVIPVGAK